MASLLWQELIERNVIDASREGLPSASSPRGGLVTFSARALIDFIESTGRVTSRASGVELGEALRARDVIRPRDGGERRFVCDSTRWVCRADEAPSPVTSFSVAALLNRGHYVLAAPMLKQGAVFLNARFFVLDRAEARLYVFSSDAASQPRYLSDFRTTNAKLALIIRRDAPA